ncbi:unnamed protein product [Heligmosomoides polygyrus]|uniref:DUF19 domain-containing protein n=1 Tax=Heligmosomoides polygyrus TaxID=6339 RepID=A0A3P7ZX85_HELPZ|nr:unnamed protein product [Heligmosomoides polygyrus]
MNAILACTLTCGGWPMKKFISKSTIDVLHGSRREETTRVCTCSEMSECYQEAKQQAFDCFDPCWNEINTYGLTKEPENLRVCFEQRRGFVDDIIHCFSTKIKACEDDPEKARVTHVKTYDYPDMIKRVEDVINEQIQTFLNSITSNHVKVNLSSSFVFDHVWSLHRPNFALRALRAHSIDSAGPICIAYRARYGGS